MKIALGNDHAAVEMKFFVKKYLEEKGYEVLNLGTDTLDSVDYPDFGAAVGRAVTGGEAELGIAICGSGVGISIAANKVKGVRAVCCSEPYSARMSREHNNANVLCFGARVIGQEMAKMIIDEFLAAKFQGGRHEKRVNKILALEE